MSIIVLAGHARGEIIFRIANLRSQKRYRERRMGCAEGKSDGGGMIYRFIFGSLAQIK